MEGHSLSVRSLCLSEDESRLYSGSSDFIIKAWDTATNTCIATLQGHTDGVTSLCLSFKTNQLISGSEDKTIRVWDTTNLPVFKRNIIKHDEMDSENMNTDCDEEEAVGQSVHTVTNAHRGYIYSLALSDNSDTVYSAGGSYFGKADLTIKAWQLKHSWA
jgi:WD40 repeat protein